jgi:hypothetical protein
MSEKESLSKLKAKLDKVSERKCKLDDEERALKKKVEELDAGYVPAREKFIKEGAAKIQEQCGWTKEELINALGGTVDGKIMPKAFSSKRVYVQLIPLGKDGNIPPAQHIRLTPKLHSEQMAKVAKDGLIPLLKHTIKVTLDEDNRKRAEAKLKKEEAKAKK